jgi:hypothetical protein
MVCLQGAPSAEGGQAELEDAKVAKRTWLARKLAQRLYPTLRPGGWVQSDGERSVVWESSMEMIPQSMRWENDIEEQLSSTRSGHNRSASARRASASLRRNAKTPNPIR